MQKQDHKQESVDLAPTLGGNRNLKSARGTSEDIEAVVPRLRKPVAARSEIGFCAGGETPGTPQVRPEVRVKVEKALMREARRLRLFYLFRIYLLRFGGLAFKAHRLFLLLRLQKARALSKLFSYAHRKLSSSRGLGSAR